MSEVYSAWAMRDVLVGWCSSKRCSIFSIGRDPFRNLSNASSSSWETLLCICIGYMRRVCTAKESREKIEFRIFVRKKSWPAKMDVDACAGERMGEGVRSRISPCRAFPFYGGRLPQLSAMQLSALTTIPRKRPQCSMSQKGFYKLYSNNCSL